MTTAIAPTIAPTPPTTAPLRRGVPPTHRLFTVDEYCAMAHAGILAEDERVELIDGEIIVMAPIGEPHEHGTDWLNRRLNYMLYDRALVRVQGSIRLNDGSLPQPDIAVVRLRPNHYRQRPTPADVLLLIEVSDTSLEFDRGVKLARYAAAGIPEVWIVNLRARQVEAHSDPVDGAYRSRRLVTAEGRISPLAFPDVSLAVGEFLLK